MAEKKRFLLRVDPDFYRVIEKWAADELRSVNAQIEWALKDAARRAGRVKKPLAEPSGPAEPGNSPD